MADAHITQVRLGDKDVPVYPQRIGYILNKLNSIGGLLAEAAAGGQEVTPHRIVMLAGDSIYDVMLIFVPMMSKRLPVWEFNGFKDEASMESGEYDEEFDRSPEVPQLVEAIRASIRVNELGPLLNQLGGGDDPKSLPTPSPETPDPSVTSTMSPSSSQPSMAGAPTMSGAPD
jgi:hypothetical protein